jgi:hypothetical protein
LPLPVLSAKSSAATIRVGPRRYSEIPGMRIVDLLDVVDSTE